MKNDDKKLDDLEKNLLKRNAEMIKKTFDSFGLKTIVAEINIEKDYTEYCLQVAVGTNLEELEKYKRNIALAVASPTGKINMVNPIPGRSLVGIQIPKYSKEFLIKIKEMEEKPTDYKWTLKGILAFIFFLIGDLSYKLARKILGKTEEDH